MGMYESPIKLLFTEIQHQIVQQQDEEIYKSVLHFIPNVDKNELIRALHYDRNQYEKGYADGKADAMAEIVRCKDCRFCIKHPTSDKVKLCTNEEWNTEYHPFAHDDGFCFYGERKGDGNED